jgi:hypothetical protein
VRPVAKVLPIFFSFFPMDLPLFIHATFVPAEILLIIQLMQAWYATCSL